MLLLLGGVVVGCFFFGFLRRKSMFGEMLEGIVFYFFSFVGWFGFCFYLGVIEYIFKVSYYRFKVSLILVYFRSWFIFGSFNLKDFLFF